MKSLDFLVGYLYGYSNLKIDYTHVVKGLNLNATIVRLSRLKVNIWLIQLANNAYIFL